MHQIVFGGATSPAAAFSISRLFLNGEPPIAQRDVLWPVQSPISLTI
jgi:hypothetical protein